MNGNSKLNQHINEEIAKVEKRVKEAHEEVQYDIKLAIRNGEISCDDMLNLASTLQLRRERIILMKKELETLQRYSLFTSSE